MFPIIKPKRDFLLGLILKVNSFFAFLAVFLILFFLTYEGANFFESKGFKLFSDQSWYPSEDKYGLTPIILGTLFTGFGSIILAIPLGLFAALFTSFYAPTKISWIVKRLIELYAGIPSVIFGFWGLMEVVPLINKMASPGQSLLAGILILTLMIFPILTLNLISSFELACKKVRLASDSLGIKLSSYIWHILIPSSKSQLLSASVLALGRALGETMAVLMVCGNIVQVPGSIFDPIRTLTANIALEMAYAQDEHRSALFVTALILFLLVTALVFLGDLFKEKE